MADRQRAESMNEAAARFADAWAESYRIVYERSTQAGERQAQLAQEFSERVLDFLKQQGESGRAASEELVEQARKRQEAGQAVAKESVDAYLNFLDTAFSQYQAGARQATETTQEGVRSVTDTATGVLGTVTDTAADTTQTVASGGQPPIDGYDEMSVEEIEGRLENLSADELRRVRVYEQANKNRASLIERVDQRIRATS